MTDDIKNSDYKLFKNTWSDKDNIKSFMLYKIYSEDEPAYI